MQGNIAMPLIVIGEVPRFLVVGILDFHLFRTQEIPNGPRRITRTVCRKPRYATDFASLKGNQYTMPWVGSLKGYVNAPFALFHSRLDVAPVRGVIAFVDVHFAVIDLHDAGYQGAEKMPVVTDQNHRPFEFLQGGEEHLP